MTHQPLTVLWLAKGLGAGGMERLLVNHAREVDGRDVRYLAASIVSRPSEVIGELEELGVTHLRLGTGSVADPRWVVDLLRTVDRYGVDIVHVHSPLPAALARIPLVLSRRPRRRRPRLVYTEHNNISSYKPLVRWAHLLTSPLDDVAIAVSDDARQSLPRRRREHVVTLHHGVSADWIRSRANREAARAGLGVADDQVVIGVVAHHRHEKDYPNVLAAAAALDRQDVVVVCIGGGPLWDESVALHASLGLGDRVRLLGRRADAIELMAACDIVSLGSRFEGLPVSIMEAKALGLPVVATRVGGLPDAVREGEGLLVPSGDADALAAAWRHVVDDSELRARLAAGSLRSAGRYSARDAAAAVERIYREVVAGVGPMADD